MKPYDVITVKGCDNGYPNIQGERQYEVCTIALGGTNQENMIGIRSWSKIPGAREEMMVPEFILASLAECGRMTVRTPVRLPE